MNSENDQEQEERQERNLDLLFSPYLDREQQRDLRSLAEYFEYVADKILYKRLFVAVPSKFLKRFEAAYLLLGQLLDAYPEAVRNQADSICEGLSLERLFAALVIESSEGQRHFSFFDALFSGFQAITASQRENQSLVNKNSLLNAKIALGRLAQLALYAASIKVEDPDDDSDEFNDHYNPDLADKAKVLALLNVLRSQTNSLSDLPLKSRLLETLEKIEVEIRKPKPRWKKVIATFFILFGFLADLKTIEPKVYDPLYRTAEAIVRVLHEEVTAQHHRQQSSIPDNDSTQSLLPSPIARLKNDDSEDTKRLDEW